MTKRFHRFRIALSGALLTALTLTAPSAYSAKPTGGSTTTCDPAKASTFGGRAYSLFLDSVVLGADLDVGPVPDTGQVPAAGGMLDATAIAINSPDHKLKVSASVLHNTAMGSGDISTAFSSVLGLNLSLSDGVNQLLGINAGVLEAKSKVKCEAGVKTVVASGTGANIVGLTINLLGVPINIPVNPGPNTGLTIPPILGLASASIILNEQGEVAGRKFVNALHVKLELLSGLIPNLTKVDLVISHAESGITCGSGTNPNCNCPVKDFVTGGGYITLPSGAKGTFGFVGGQKANGLQGNLTFSDHTGTGKPKQLFGRGVTGYAGAGSTTPTRTVTYSCTVDDMVVAGGCAMRVSDFSEPGTDSDEFSLTSAAYSAAPAGMQPTITQGNIQLHVPNCGPSSTGTKKPRR